MQVKKPKFWDYKKPNYIALILWPISKLIQLINIFKLKKKIKFTKIKTICIGNIYLGGTGKTSLAIKINDLLGKKNIKCCFIKKYYPNQIDEIRLLQKNGVVFTDKNRVASVKKAINQKFEYAIFDDGLQDHSIDYDYKLLCFNTINWIGNGLEIPSGPLRENIRNLKKYSHVFLNGNTENNEKIKKYILKINPKISIYYGSYNISNLEEFNIKENFIAFSGIGNHQSFIYSLKKNKIKVIKDIEYADHYNYSNKDLMEIVELAKKLNCKIVTTEKDYLRINNENKINIQVVKSKLSYKYENDLINNILNLNAKS